MAASPDPQVQVIHQGRHLTLARREGWEYVTRRGATGVVAIVPLHEDGRVVLVEQHRPPLNAATLELPAGLAGDGDGEESLLQAARRELEEETGYTAEHWLELGSAVSSGGLTDEEATFFLARGLRRTSPGGGVEGEAIRLHEVPLSDLPQWLQQRMAQGVKVDAKLMAGVYWATTKQTPRASARGS